MIPPNHLLDLMLADMADADPLYRPTHFWQSGLTQIIDDLRRHGFDSFRSHRSATSWYVPLYRSGVYSRHPRVARAAVAMANLVSGRRRLGDRLRWMLEGCPRFHFDHAVFNLAQGAGELDLKGIGESSIGQPCEQFVVDGLRFSRASLNYLRGLSLLSRCVDLPASFRTLEIGGGYGALGEILLRSHEDAFYLDVDIPPVAAVASYYLTEVFGEAAVLTYEKAREMRSIDLQAISRDYRAAVLCPWQMPSFQGHVDLFVNFISFQEMEPEIVANYSRLVSELTRSWILLRNSRWGKPVVRRQGEVGVLRATTTDDMLAMFDGFSLVARDARTFGDSSWDGSFESEVLCLRRSGERVA